jgi:hypothetical protein
MKRQIAQSVRGIVRLAGIDLHPYSKTEWKWGYDVHEYYPVTPTARWGYGKPPHSKMTEILDRNDYSGLIDTISRFGDLYASVPQKGNPDGTVPFWQQSWFHDFDAVALMGIIASKRPKRYFGSGNSTKFARHTIERNNLPTKITSLDPNPRASIDALCDRVIRYPLEDCDLVLLTSWSGETYFFLTGPTEFLQTLTLPFFSRTATKIKARSVCSNPRYFPTVGLPARLGEETLFRTIYAGSDASMPDPTFQRDASQLAPLPPPRIQPGHRWDHEIHRG